MELFSPPFFSALFSLVIIDLVLAGDNAIVVGLAARNLPKQRQNTVIMLGTVGAVVVRALATLGVVWLLKIPGLLLAGGIMLIWTAFKLLVEEKSHEIRAASTMWAAIRTIILADAIMGLDNVLAVAGAAHGSFMLVILGLLISVPIVVWGSTLVIRIMDKFPLVVYLGSAVIAFTAGKMIFDEPLIHAVVVPPAALKWTTIISIVAGILLAGKSRRQATKNPAA